MRRGTQNAAVKTLTARQQYLLQRIPGKYELNGFHRPAEPREVAHARKVVDRWEKAMALKKCQHDKRTEALTRKAREAVYFHSDERALAIIQQVEKLLKGCEE